jgi:hypothetical protein
MTGGFVIFAAHRAALQPCGPAGMLMLSGFSLSLLMRPTFSLWEHPEAPMMCETVSRFLRHTTVRLTMASFFLTRNYGCV